MSRAGAAACAARLCPGIGRVHYGAAASRKEPEIEYGALLLKDAALTLLLPVGLFDATQKYTLCCEDRYQVVKMERVLERGPNFEQIEISQVQMQRAA